MGKRKAQEYLKQVSDRETEILLEILRRCLGVEGDVVELGCYRGDTSLLFERVVEEWNRGGERKKLWIYDSFEGLPDKSAEDESVAGTQFQAGELAVTKREVVERFKRAGLRVPVVKKGFFEELGSDDLPERICFGFLDGDLYGSIRTSLRLCAPRVAKGGVLVVHDYNNPELPGVTKAVDEFLRGRTGVELKVRESLAILRF